MKKIYMVFVIERIISSILIILLPAVLSIISAILIGIYGIVFIGLIIVYKKATSTNIIEPISK